MELAGFRFGVVASDERFWADAESRYEHFWVADGASPDELVTLELVDDEPVPESTSETDFVASRDGSVLELRPGRAVVRWDRAQHTCEVRQHVADVDAGYVFGGVGSALRMILGLRLADAGGAMLHAAGLVRGGRAHVFVGESGAGKTTLCRVSSYRAGVLSDDAVALRWAGDTLMAHPTPFPGEFGPPTAHEPAPLEWLGFLRQAPTNALVPLRPAEAIRRLLPNLMVSTPDRAGADLLFDTASELCGRVPCRELAFVPDETLWEVVDG